ncbi:hypothetical protein C8R45DRAFT_1043861 [Mycena sanguinolenta]|nr:hypothetical protein C8R45DRAFT_1043861 [Mycena sanguinolenta]
MLKLPYIYLVGTWRGDRMLEKSCRMVGPGSVLLARTVSPSNANALHFPSFNWEDVVDRTIIVSVALWSLDKKFWLSQANHIFTSLQLEIWSSSKIMVVFVDHIDYVLTISPTELEGPARAGFLFLSPSKDFRTERISCKWPDCPACWSFDPSGAGPLSSEDAVDLGFPSFRLSMKIKGYSWDTSVYAGLRQFHEVEGSYPEIQDVTLHLGHPLYQLSEQIHTPFVHIDHKDFHSIHDGDDANKHLRNQGFCDAPESASTSRSTDRELESPDASTPQMCHRPDGEQLPLSGSFKLVMHVPLSLILFLAMFWVLY